MQITSGTGLLSLKAQTSLSASGIHAAAREENKLQSSGSSHGEPQEVGQAPWIIPRGLSELLQALKCGTRFSVPQGEAAEKWFCFPSRYLLLYGGGQGSP